jgi:hypothetical protein
LPSSVQYTHSMVILLSLVIVIWSLVILIIITSSLSIDFTSARR